MITINYQAYGTKELKLRLRFYQDGETRYVAVNKQLHGNLTKKHWNAKRQAFRDSAPFSVENNRFLYDFKKPYVERAADWKGSLSAYLLSFSDSEPTIADKDRKTFADLFSYIITEQKKKRHADGTQKGTFECYEKAERRIREFCTDKKIDYEEITLDEIDENLVNKFFEWIQANGKGYVYCSQTLHAALTVADKHGWFDFGRVKNCKWKGKYGTSRHKHETLTKEQCKMFAGLKPSEMPSSRYSELYRDFCLFMLNTAQSPCDAISSKRSQIRVTSGGSYLEFKRRKISDRQMNPCNVPINAEMQRIIDKWLPYSSDGYIFPIRNKKTMKHATNNYDIKKFISKLNMWLKKVGETIGCKFPLHSYVFRHTAITFWISSGIDLIYVANTAGTSVKNCESIYYDNLNDGRNHFKFLSVSNY